MRIWPAAGACWRNMTMNSSSARCSPGSISIFRRASSHRKNTMGELPKKRAERGDRKLDADLARSWRLLAQHDDEFKLGALFAWLDKHIPARKLAQEKYHG